jgi:hypothetical protein
VAHVRVSNTITQAAVASAMGRRDNQTTVDERLAKHIAAQQAGPNISRVNHNDRHARISATLSATGDAIFDAICTRIGIQNDTASILPLGESPRRKWGQAESRRKWGQAESRLATWTVQRSHPQDQSMHSALELRPEAKRKREKPDLKIRDVAASFVSGSEACHNTCALFTDQECLSYVYHSRTTGP